MDEPSPRAFAEAADAFRAHCARTYLADLDFGLDSVGILDGILGEAWQRHQGLPAPEASRHRERLTEAAGAYFGEVLVRATGASWGHDGPGKRVHDWWVRAGPRAADRIPCFAIVHRFLTQGPSDSLLATVLPLSSSPSEVSKPKNRREGRRVGDARKRRTDRVTETRRRHNTS